VPDPEAIVYVVDDDASVRRATERLVRAAGLTVRTFASAREFLDHPRPDAPACLVLDVRMPGQSGLELQDEIARSAEPLPIIFVTGHGDIPMTVRAMKAGAVEFMTKPYREADLLGAICGAIERDRAARRDRRDASALRRRYEQLTPRERQVMARVVAGLLNKQIADELSTAERTVKFHRGHLMTKMQAASLAELVQMATQLGIVPGAARPVPEDS
jgi:FixJ family two-component response regulator